MVAGTNACNLLGFWEVTEKKNVWRDVWRIGISDVSNVLLFLYIDRFLFRVRLKVFRSIRIEGKKQYIHWDFPSVRALINDSRLCIEYAEIQIYTCTKKKHFYLAAQRTLDWFNSQVYFFSLQATNIGLCFFKSKSRRRIYIYLSPWSRGATSLFFLNLMEQTKKKTYNIWNLNDSLLISRITNI